MKLNGAGDIRCSAHVTAFLLRGGEGAYFLKDIPLLGACYCFSLLV
jgi:hypothetical protein